MKKLILLLLLFASITMFAQDKKPDKEELKEYFFVMLKRGTNLINDKDSVSKLQAGHRANIRKMAEAGKLSIAGPFGDNGDWRGIFIMNTQSIEEAKKLIDEDPMIRAGLLIYEIRPWWSKKGAKLN